MARKQKKTRAETSAEDFFPVESRDVKYAIEKVEARIAPEIEKVESVGKKIIDKIIGKKTKKAKKKISNGKKSTKKRATKASKAIDYEPAKTKLKSGGYELIITEKPQAAMKIASALGDSTARNAHGVPYYEVSRQE